MTTRAAKRFKQAIIAVFLTLLAVMLFCQVVANDKAVGRVWKTDKVTGEVEVFHVLGRAAVMPVKNVWVNINGEWISIGANCDDPVIDGKRRPDYQMANMVGKLNKAYPGNRLQLLTDTGIVTIGKDFDVLERRVAMIIIRDGVPVAVEFTCSEFADFDVPSLIDKLKTDGSAIALQEAEFLTGFNEQGFRQRSFRALF